MDPQIQPSSLEPHLLCSYSFSDKMLEKVKAQIEGFMVGREKDDSYFNFVNWKRLDNEIVVLTAYAFDDIILPKKYDTVFQIGNLTNFINVDFLITQAVLNGQVPVKQISKGHKHICVIRFEKELNNMFDLLTPFDGQNSEQAIIQLGFCCMDDLKN